LFDDDDHVAPQVASDFVLGVPPGHTEGSPKGETVSSFVQTLQPSDPYSPSDPYGPQLSDHIALLHGFDTLTDL
jgi:hypothetical protein